MCRLIKYNKALNFSRAVSLPPAEIILVQQIIRFREILLNFDCSIYFSPIKGVYKVFISSKRLSFLFIQFINAQSALKYHEFENTHTGC